MLDELGEALLAPVVAGAAEQPGAPRQRVQVVREHRDLKPLGEPRLVAQLEPHAPQRAFPVDASGLDRRRRRRRRRRARRRRLAAAGAAARAEGAEDGGGGVEMIISAVSPTATGALARRGRSRVRRRGGAGGGGRSSSCSARAAAAAARGLHGVLGVARRAAARASPRPRRRGRRRGSQPLELAEDVDRDHGTSRRAEPHCESSPSCHSSTNGFDGSRRRRASLTAIHRTSRTSGASGARADCASSHHLPEARSRSNCCRRAAARG